MGHVGTLIFAELEKAVAARSRPVGMPLQNHLATMLEQEVKTFLKQTTSRLKTRRTALDFRLPRHKGFFNVKEKVQAFSMKN